MGTERSQPRGGQSRGGRGRRPVAVVVASGSGPGLVTAVSRRVLHSTQTNPSGLSCHVQPRRPDLLGPLPDHTPTPQRAPREKPGLLERVRGGGDPACASSALLARAAVLAVGGQTPAGDGVPVPEPGLRQRRPEQAPPTPTTHLLRESHPGPRRGSRDVLSLYPGTSYDIQGARPSCCPSSRRDIASDMENEMKRSRCEDLSWLRGSARRPPRRPRRLRSALDAPGLRARPHGQGQVAAETVGHGAAYICDSS